MREVRSSELRSFLDDIVWEKRSVSAAKKLTGISEEERKIMLMWPDEKKFFLKYKKKNPGNPWGYFKEYQLSIQNKYNSTGKLA